LNKSDIDQLKKIAASSGEKIEQSAVFLSIMTGSYKDDPVCAMQLGIAILLEKPLCFLVPNGTTVPRALERLADTIEFFEYGNNEDMHKATRRIFATMKERGIF